MQHSILLGAAALMALAPGCQRTKNDKADTVEELASESDDQVPALPPQTPDELAAPLAKVDDVVITVGEFQERINKQSPYIRQRYTSLEQKREFLDNMIRFEIMAKEAFRRGLDKHPDVVRTMKQVMIQKLMKAELASTLKPEDITEAEMRAFYDSHADEYNKPEEMRVAAIIVGSKSKAEMVAKKAKGDEGKTPKGFRRLVSKYSQDDKTKIRGGDLRYFGRDSTEVPKPVVEAAFTLDKSGDVAGPIRAGGRYYIIKHTGKRKAVTKGFDSVKRQLQNRIYRDKRTQAQKDFIGGLRKKARIEINDKALSKVRVDTSKAAGGHSHGKH